jgi:hypothetical protein
MTAEDHRDSADINFSWLSKIAFVPTTTMSALGRYSLPYSYPSPLSHLPTPLQVPIGSLTGFAGVSPTVVKMANEDLAKMIDREGKENEGSLENRRSTSVKSQKRNVITTGSRFTKAPYRASLLTRILRESNAIFYDTPVHEWTNAQLSAWLSCAEGGRFSHLALPPGIDGATLFRQEVASLSAMFTGELRQARTEKEGGAWLSDR